MIRMLFDLLGIAFLLLAAACIWVLVEIKGQSDGPGALVFYIGALGGALIAWFVLITTRSEP